MQSRGVTSCRTKLLVLDLVRAKNLGMRTILFFVWMTGGLLPLMAAEFHVSARNGDDRYDGSARRPFKTISAAADVAQPGDVITVHEGVYRERVNPPRGGESDIRRIVYQAARGAKVEIKGSEVISGWRKVEGDVWQVVIPNTFFGDFNPYRDLIRGDWFDPRGREHHTGAVYLNGDWLTEAASLDELFGRGKAAPSGVGQYLLNVAWFRPVTSAGHGNKTAAADFAAQQGVQTAQCSEGGQCIGWIEHGDWARYDRVDFGKRTTRIEFRAASAANGGLIEVRLDNPEGELLGTCVVPNTGDWQSWSSFTTRIKPMSGIRTVCLVFKSGNPVSTPGALWFAKVDDANTTIWAQFPGVDPNKQLVEINVRRSVFYPDRPGRNYITVRGFIMRHAATPWAPPTAEQVGLIGTHWSKGWIIENNVISHSVCSGISLGKYGDQYDNTSANTAEGYVKTIERALANGWNRDTIGHHIVRNNTISHCEQAGIVGSLGAAFSTVSDNTIHHVHVRRLFSGAEMAGIKFHAAIDTTIRGNHIYQTCLGLWLDWMAQGTRVTRNLFHDNSGQDLFVEVNHGPFLVDNNIFLSPVSLLDMSEGGAYAHNLFAGRIISRPELGRKTPWHPAHSTVVAGLTNIHGGDDRFFNNIFIGKGRATATTEQSVSKDPQWTGGYGLWVYDWREFPLMTGGNVYLNGARPWKNEQDTVVLNEFDPNPALVQRGGRFELEITMDKAVLRSQASRVTSALLGKPRVSNVPYVAPDDSPLAIDIDYSGKARNATNPHPGPFEALRHGRTTARVW